MFDPWEWLTLATRLWLYLSTAASLGGYFSFYLLPANANGPLPWLRRYTATAALLGLIGAPLSFLVQVGAFAGAGIGGMFDPEIGIILLQSGVGKAASLQVAGFALALLPMLVSPEIRRSGISAAVIFAGLGMLCLVLSYTVTGHAVNHGELARAAVFLHVLTISLWVGALPPLWMCCRRLPDGALLSVMHHFSARANYIIVILVLAGVYLLITIMGTATMSWTDRYGVNLALKLLLAAALLALGAANKWIWTGKLRQGISTPLCRSIQAETLIAVLLLAATAVLTTLSAA